MATIRINSPKAKELLARFPQIETLHLRRTMKDTICFVGINRQDLGRFYLNEESKIIDGAKALLVEFNLTSNDLNSLLEEISSTWINRMVYTHRPVLKGALWSRFITFRKDGQIEIHDKKGRASANDPRVFCREAI